MVNTTQGGFNTCSGRLPRFLAGGGRKRQRQLEPPGQAEEAAFCPHSCCRQGGSAGGSFYLNVDLLGQQ